MGEPVPQDLRLFLGELRTMVEDGVLPWTIQRDAGGRSSIEVVNQDPTGLRQMGREFRLLFDRVL
ncbi:MAG: hypothetical protein E6K69_01505 [Nitrospirae bacterium]|nr:MAG: hypothetical protein E6K69_01505 [Nitrospirota bacterium]